MMDNFSDYIVKFIALLLLILTPIQPIMLAVFALVILDMITGVWAAKKRGETITSDRLRKTVSKTLAYQMALVVGLIVEVYLVPDIPTIKVIAGLIAITEGKSFFENMNTITGVDFWSLIVDKIHGSKIFPTKKQ